MKESGCKKICCNNITRAEVTGDMNCGGVSIFTYSLKAEISTLNYNSENSLIFLQTKRKKFKIWKNCDGQDATEGIQCW